MPRVRASLCTSNRRQQLLTFIGQNYEVISFFKIKSDITAKMNSFPPCCLYLSNQFIILINIRKLSFPQPKILYWNSSILFSTVYNPIFFFFSKTNTESLQRRWNQRMFYVFARKITKIINSFLSGLKLQIYFGHSINFAFCHNELNICSPTTSYKMSRTEARCVHGQRAGWHWATGQRGERN